MRLDVCSTFLCGIEPTIAAVRNHISHAFAKAIAIDELTPACCGICRTKSQDSLGPRSSWLPSLLRERFGRKDYNLEAVKRFALSSARPGAPEEL